MKNILYILIIILPFYSCNTSKPVTKSDKIDLNKTAYWFYVYIREDNLENSEIKKYHLQLLSSAPEKGTLKQYDYALWHYLSEGTKLAVGPFNNLEEAKTALKFYKVSTETASSLDKNREIFWFVLHVNRRERSRSWELERIPAAIASGTYSKFEVFLKENLTLHIMTIGPFNTMPDAEESKRTYRLH